MARWEELGGGFRLGLSGAVELGRGRVRSGVKGEGWEIVRGGVRVSGGVRNRGG